MLAKNIEKLATPLSTYPLASALSSRIKNIQMKSTRNEAMSKIITYLKSLYRADSLLYTKNIIVATAVTVRNAVW
jgi:hypothetical protein